MDVSDALKERYTCRAFKSDPIGMDVLKDIFESACRAPSWANTQPWEIYVAGGDILESLRRGYLENFLNSVPGEPDLARPSSWPEAISERMKALQEGRMQSLGAEINSEAARRDSAERNNRFFDAPVVAYLCLDKSLSPWSIHDLGMFSQSLMLAAADRGVASAIAYNLVIYPDLIRQELDIPYELSIIIGIALGYAREDHMQNRFRSSRRPLDEAVRFVGF